MTQIVFAVGEIPSASRLNQATQGYKLLRRTTYAGSTGSPVGNAIIFTTTWSPGSGTSALYVRVGGPGGGSPAARAGTPAGTSGVSGGGGGGGYTEGLILGGFTPNQPIDIGLGGLRGIGLAAAFPGGQSRFGTMLSASGGLPGQFQWHANATTFAGGGLGGVGSGGNINASGACGGVGFIFSPNLSALSGRGGQGALAGSGGQEVGALGGVQLGRNGLLWGGGASGALVANAGSLVNADGANGAPGFVDIWEYA